MGVRMNKKSLKDRVSEIAGLPKDVTMGMSIIRIIGHHELYIENYRGILEYSDTNLRILTKMGQICITGARLEIVYYNNDEMKIEGVFENIYLKRGGA